MDGLTSKMGRFFELAYKLPFVGDRVVRSLNRKIGYLTFNNPLSKMQKHDSIQGVKQEFLKLGSLSDGEIIITKEDDCSFEYLSSPCPYGFRRPEQKGVCDAAMEMNRRLFDLCGAKLIIHESISSGAPRCRITIEMKDKNGH